MISENGFEENGNEKKKVGKDYARFNFFGLGQTK